MRKIIINTAHKVYVINTDDIIYIKAMSSYSLFILIGNKEVVSSQPISLYNELLREANFFRTHKSFLINLDHVVEIDKTGDVIMSEGSEVPIVKENIKLLVQAFAHSI